MQNPTAYPRDALTLTQVVNLIQLSSGIRIDKGLELIDINLFVLEDISAELAPGGTITRDAFSTIHGSCTLNISRELDWGAAIVRPYVVLMDDTVTAKFYMGAYYLSVPTRDYTEVPHTHQVTGFDILTALSDPVGDAYTVAAGTLYTDAIETILLNIGYSKYSIDRLNTATLPASRTWAFANDLNWLGIVNDLCQSIGYQGIWSDWNGVLQVRPYDPPLQRTPEWTYSHDQTTSMVSETRTLTVDYFTAPNKWVFYLNNQTDTTVPVEGAGRVTMINQSSGPTSVDGRAGRTITKVLGIDAADQPSLVAAGTLTMNADISLTQVIDINTFPNPLHWHFDRLLLTDPDIGTAVDVQSTKWTFDLDGADMVHQWTILGV